MPFKIDRFWKFLETLPDDKRKIFHRLENLLQDENDPATIEEQSLSLIFAMTCKPDDLPEDDEALILCHMNWLDENFPDDYEPNKERNN